MIGNDIVDLKQAAKDSNWKRPRFLDKVFTKKEQQLIFNSENQHQMVWLLWSMKEAAYKVNVQQFGKRFFNPKRIECKLISNQKGSVRIGSESYFTHSILNENIAYSVATLSNDKNYTSEWFKIKTSEYQSQSAMLKAHFLSVFPEETVTLEIKKNHLNIPQLYKGGKALNLSFSLTHHGLYCGLAF
ncbi:4'-phosphopantetheinyl transferase family protein [Lacinutrix salivirga]